MELTVTSNHKEREIPKGIILSPLHDDAAGCDLGAAASLALCGQV